MKIESGKYYRTRDGRKVGPMINEGWSDGEPWTADNSNRYYTDNGTRVIDAGESDDIISEWPSETLTPHQQRTADMIKVMQAYVDGADIQVRSAFRETGYMSASQPCWDFTSYDYRIAPADTPDTIDWSHVAPEFKWMARNSNGTAFLHEREPRILPANRWTSMASARVSHNSYHRGTCDWKDSLVKRP